MSVSRFWPIKFDKYRETDRHYVEGPQLAVLIVVHQDHLLYSRGFIIHQLMQVM